MQPRRKLREPSVAQQPDETTEDHAAALLHEHIPCRQVQIKADKVNQIKDQMDQDHAENANAAQRIQFPDAVVFFHGNHLKSSQPAAKRGRLPKNNAYEFFASSNA